MWIFAPQRLRDGQNGVCFNRVSCKIDRKNDFLVHSVNFEMDDFALEKLKQQDAEQVEIEAFMDYIWGHSVGFGRVLSQRHCDFICGSIRKIRGQLFGFIKIQKNVKS